MNKYHSSLIPPICRGFVALFPSSLAQIDLIRVHVHGSTPLQAGDD